MSLSIRMCTPRGCPPPRARAQYPTVGAPLVGALPRAPTSSRGTPCPPPRAHVIPVGAPLVGALPRHPTVRAHVCPTQPTACGCHIVGAPLVGALPRAPTSSNRRGTPCGCPPPCGCPARPSPTVCPPTWVPYRSRHPRMGTPCGCPPPCALVPTWGTQRSWPVGAPLVGALPSPVDGPLMYTTQRSLTYHSGRGTPRGCPPLPPVPSPPRAPFCRRNVDTSPLALHRLDGVLTKMPKASPTDGRQFLN